MPMGPYENFDACVLDQKSKWHDEESAAKICGTIKAETEWTKHSERVSLSEASPKLAKRVIDALSKAGKDMEMMNYVIYKLECMIVDELLKERLNSASDEDIQKIVDTIIEEKVAECYSEITLSDENFSEDRQYELITTAKQTDSRYGDFSYTKEQLETMAANFNENVVGTEIPVDLNHDPEHIAYAWIKPGSMEVKESTQLAGHYSLYAQLYRFTPEGRDMVSTGKVRYFSLQIQNSFTKFIDKTKKVYNLVIRALALTNMPVIKDMAPTFNEGTFLFNNHTKNMAEVAELEKKLSDNAAESARLLSEKDAENKRLSEELANIKKEKRDIALAEEVEKLCLSDKNTVAFKGGEKPKILEFVKTLSEEQATAYFALHSGIITSVDLGEHGQSTAGGEVNYNEIAEARAVKLAGEKNISVAAAYSEVLAADPELAKNVY